MLSTAALLKPADVEYLKLSVHRKFVLEESMDHLCCIQHKNLRSVIRVNFLEESGVDAGGLHREWFMMLSEALLQESTGLFTCTNKQDQAYYLNPRSKVDRGDDHLMYFYGAGRLIGRALLEGTVLGFHLCVPLLKLVLGMPVTFDDLAYYDPEMHKHLQWLLDNDGVDALALDFSVCVAAASGTDVEVVDLIPNGRNVAVTDANKREFVARKLQYVLIESVADQLFVFCAGIHEVLPPQLLMLFDHEEFDFVLCGNEEIDVDEWAAATVVSANLKGTVMEFWFWDIVRAMPNEYKRRLLHFATG